MIFSIVTLAATMASASALIHPNDDQMLKFMWKSFKQEHNKSYDANEEAHRFKIFGENLKVADRRNAEEGAAIHGINKFSDLTQQEFADNFLGGVAPSSGIKTGKVVDSVPASSNSSKDWSGVYTTPVKNQGYCGSCWAFSATEQLESDTMRALGRTFVLSAEQVTQCTKGSAGCGGGWTETAYNYIKNEGGIESEDDYPYTSYYGKTGTCNPDKRKEVVGLTGFTTINGETNMANYVLETGPLSICIDANTWNSYTGGIMTKCGKQIDHCVQAVGVDTGVNGYWKVRNSWGVTWGEQGYIRLAYGQDTCGITNDPTYVDPVIL